MLSEIKIGEFLFSEKNKFFADSGTIRHSRVGMQVEGSI